MQFQKEKEGKPAHSDSISPADMIIGSISSALNISSVWNDFPWPFPPHTPENANQVSDLLSTWTATFSSMLRKDERMFGQK